MTEKARFTEKSQSSRSVNRQLAVLQSIYYLLSIPLSCRTACFSGYRVFFLCEAAAARNWGMINTRGERPDCKDLPDKVNSFTLLQIKLKVTLALLCVISWQNRY